jgi:hypothetical protein
MLQIIETSDLFRELYHTSSDPFRARFSETLRIFRESYRTPSDPSSARFPETLGFIPGEIAQNPQIQFQELRKYMTHTHLISIHNYHDLDH